MCGKNETKQAVPGFKIGDRVAYADPASEYFWEGTISGSRNNEYGTLLHVFRDDGVDGSGPSGAWTIYADSKELRRIGAATAPQPQGVSWPTDPVHVSYPAQFKPLLDAALAQASARREYNAAQQHEQDTRGPFHAAQEARAAAAKRKSEAERAYEDAVREAAKL